MQLMYLPFLNLLEESKLKMNEYPETNKESRPMLNELLAIRTELKKLNQKAIDIERSTKNTNRDKLLKSKPLLIISSLLALNIISSLLQSFITNNALNYAKQEINKPMTFQHKVVSPSDTSFSDAMNNEGSAGWQAVNCRRAKDSITDEFSYECIMIRKK